jgi:hypothetical protein
VPKLGAPIGHVFRRDGKRRSTWYAKYRLPEDDRFGGASARWTERGRPPASNAGVAVGVRGLQRHMRRAVSVMLAMPTVLPTSLRSRSLSACHSTTQSAPA